MMNRGELVRQAIREAHEKALEGKERIEVLEVNKYYGYMDFTVDTDPSSVYRYEEQTNKMKKLFGIGNFGKAIRGNDRKEVERLVSRIYMMA